MDEIKTPADRDDLRSQPAAGTFRSAMRGHHVTPRRAQGISALLLTVLLVGIVTAIPVPYVSMSPGPTYNILGKVRGAHVIRISGHQTYSSTGQLDLVTVRQVGGPEGGLTLTEALRAWADPASEVVPTSVLFAPGSTNAQVKAVNKAQFVGAEGSAIAAAMSYLKIPTTTSIIVSSVVSGLPADGALRPEDEFVSVNGVKVRTPKDVSGTIRKLPIGSSVAAVIRRDGKQMTARMRTVENPQRRGTSYVGIVVATYAKAPFPIEFTLTRVGGPSAGMMFAIALIDTLTPGDMTGGRHIVGTGTIEATGEVGPIGGIAQKMISAKRAGGTLFLAPVENCPDVVGHIPAGLQVVKVGTLAQAVAAVTAYGRGERSGSALPACSAR